MAKTTQPGTLSKVLLRVKRYWAAMIGSIALSAVYVAMSLYIPILVGDAIDCIVEAGHVDFAKMGEYLLKVAICAGAAGLSQWVMNVLNNHVTYRVTQDLRQEAFRHIQDLPLSYLDTHPQDTEALALFRQYTAMEKAARAAYEDRFGPLTQSAAGGDSYRWLQEPWPWCYEQNEVK